VERNPFDRSLRARDLLHHDYLKQDPQGRDRQQIRHLFRALGVNSRLEAVAAARAASPY
jgi:hypothetical protein